MQEIMPILFLVSRKFKIILIEHHRLIPGKQQGIIRAIDTASRAIKPKIELIGDFYRIIDFQKYFEAIIPVLASGKFFITDAVDLFSTE